MKTSIIYVLYIELFYSYTLYIFGFLKLNSNTIWIYGVPKINNLICNENYHKSQSSNIVYVPFPKVFLVLKFTIYHNI